MNFFAVLMKKEIEQGKISAGYKEKSTILILVLVFVFQGPRQCGFRSQRKSKCDKYGQEGSAERFAPMQIRKGDQRGKDVRPENWQDFIDL